MSEENEYRAAEEYAMGSYDRSASNAIDQYVPGWCPYCGDPEEVCESWGGCNENCDEE